MPRKLLTISLARVRWDVLAERLKAPRGDTDKVRPARVSCRQKEIGINGANESVVILYIYLE